MHDARRKTWVEGTTAEDIDAHPPEFDYSKARLLFAVSPDKAIAEFRARDISVHEAVEYLMAAIGDVAQSAGMTPEEFRDFIHTITGPRDRTEQQGGYL